MSKSKVANFFNPAEHLALYSDKDGNMIGGGYQVNNMLYQHKMPLFVSYNEGAMTGGNRNIKHSNEEDNSHFIPEKFSDLFRDLAVPAGLFMMPSLYRPRQYDTCVTDTDTDTDQGLKPINKLDSDSDSDSDGDDIRERKPVPNDIFDTLLSLVTPSEKIQHDVKTRRRGKNGRKNKERTRKGKI
jgi:hypothetical protein